MYTMKQHTLLRVLAFVFGLALSFSPVLVPSLAFAANATSSAAGSAHASAADAARMTQMKNRADQELDRRSKNVSDVLAKVPDIKNLSQSGIAAIQTTLNNNVTALSALKSKIDADTDLATLQSDVKQITDSYRVYALVVPQLRIIIAADHAVTIAGEMHLLETLLADRVSAAGASGTDVTAMTAKITDLDTNVSAAVTAAQAAVSAIGTLTPDQTGAAPFGANLKVLQDARAKVVAAQKALATARADAASIIAFVKGKPVTAPRAASSTQPTAPTTGQ